MNIQKELYIMQIKDNFYTKENFKELFKQANKLEYKATKQPLDNGEKSRMYGYPCWQTDIINQDSDIYNILFSTLESKFDLNIKKIKTYFRKIYTQELRKSTCFANGTIKHIDDPIYKQAGVIYFDSKFLKWGIWFWVFYFIVSYFI